MSNMEVLRRAMECFGDPARRPSYFDLYADNVVLHGYAGVEPGLDSVKNYYAAFWLAFPDAKLSAGDVVEQGDKVALRFGVSATHLGPFMNMPPTGRPISIEGFTILHFNAGKCVERWAMFDSMALLAQLGVNVLPG